MNKHAWFAIALLGLLGATLIACASPSSAPGDYYENDLHGGYPGPAPKTNDRDS
jgi:hypothetical protein